MTVAIDPRRGGARVVGIHGSGGGGKGGGSARTPVESPDSLHNTSYAAVLDIISNGEVAGPVHPDAPLRDVYLDGTPVQNEDGTLNFERVQFDYRVGTIDQEHISGFPAAASVTQVGQEVRTDVPWVQSLSNPDLSAVRVSLHAPQIIKYIESGDNAGDRVGTRVDYAIDLAVGAGSFAEVLRGSFDGKTVNGYTRTHRIDLPQSNSGWRVRVRRITPESTTSAITDAFYVQTYAEVIDGKFVYPMTALAGIKIDAEQFQAIPTRAYRWRGQIIRVPSNYDPIARTYTGVWDGTFKRAWSNNPAWVYYDMLTSKLYGLGERIDASMIDRYALYQIGAYCDQLVPDGLGGMEPRFVCNVCLQGRADALRVLNDLTSVFRGMAYWANGQAVAVADMPSDPVYTYTNGNVQDGRFTYTGADISTIKTVALVSWNDPTDFYRSKVEVVEDSDGIARYGVRKTEIVAFGCTSRGQAQRVGLYHLYTSRMETGGVSFSVGLDGVIPQPGSLVKIADRNRAGRRIGGRIKHATASTITVDADHPIKSGDTLTVNLPDGSTQSRPVTQVSDRIISVSPAFDAAPVEQAVWAVDADDLVTQTVRVVSVRERDGINYDIEGVFHHPGKFQAIDTGVRLDPLPVSVVPPRVQTAPTNIQITQHWTIHQGVSRHRAEITWDAPEYATSYDVQWRRDNGDWVQVPRTGTRLVELTDIYAGTYIVRIRAINSLDVPSLWAYSDATELDGQVGEPPTLAGLTTQSQFWGITVNWAFPPGPNIVERTEVRYSQTPDFADAIPLGYYAYPTDSVTQNSLKAGATHFYWARLVDKNGQPSAWYPGEDEPGVVGTASVDTDGYSDLVTQDILESALGQQMWSDIGSIPTLQSDIEDVLGVQIPDLREQLLQQGGDISQIDEAISNLEAQLADIVGAPEHEPAQAYLAGQLVKSGGGLYRALQDVPAGTPITDAAYWEKVGDYDSLGEAVASLLARMTNVEAAADELTGELVAQSQEILALQSDVQSLDGAVAGQAQAIEETNTRVTELDGQIESTAQQTSALVAARRDDDDGAGLLADVLNEWDSRAWIYETRRVMTSNERAQAEVNTQLGAQIGNNTALLQSVQQTIATDKQAQALTNQQLQSDLSALDETVAGQAQALQQLETDVELIDDVVTSTAQQTSALTASMRDDDDGAGLLADVLNQWDSRAWIYETQRVIANSERAQAQVNELLGAQIGNVTSQVEDISQAVTNLDGTASAMRTIRVGINDNGTQYLAGIGVGIDNAGGVVQSTVAVLADRFAVMRNVNGSPTTVFSTQGDQTIINSALIGDATIGIAKITNQLASTALINGQPRWEINKGGDIVLRSGRIQNGDNSSFLNLNATGSGLFLKLGDKLSYSDSGGLVLNQIDVIDTFNVKPGSISSFETLGPITATIWRNNEWNQIASYTVQTGFIGLLSGAGEYVFSNPQTGGDPLDDAELQVRVGSQVVATIALPDTGVVGRSTGTGGSMVYYALYSQLIIPSIPFNSNSGVMYIYVRSSGGSPSSENARKIRNLRLWITQIKR